MVARLCRFYPGLTPEAVLTMRGDLRSALAMMLPRLQAEEALTLANMVGVGTATIEQQERAKLWRRLARLAAGPKRREPKPLDADPRVHAERLAAIGLNVVVEERLPDGSVREVTA